MKNQNLKGGLFTIGVDAGEVTGIGVWNNLTNSLYAIKTTDFFGVEFYLTNFKRTEIKIFVEIPPDFIYTRNSFQKGAVRDKTALQIGGNIREAELLLKKLLLLNYDAVGVPPIHSKKWTQAEFERILKTDIKTNQHCRDSSRIAWMYAGKTIVDSLNKQKLESEFVRG